MKETLALKIAASMSAKAGYTFKFKQEYGLISLKILGKDGQIKSFATKNSALSCIEEAVIKRRVILEKKIVDSVGSKIAAELGCTSA